MNTQINLYQFTFDFPDMEMLGHLTLEMEMDGFVFNIERAGKAQVLVSTLTKEVLTEIAETYFVYGKDEMEYFKRNIKATPITSII